MSKHSFAEIEVPVGDDFTTVVMLNIHLRAWAREAELRQRQARLAHRWVSDLIQSGKQVIVLGDTNSEIGAGGGLRENEIGILCGLETEATNDDLVDLHTRLDPNARDTHLVPGKEFDRIFVSKNLIEDSPNQLDLVFSGIEVRKDLTVRAGPDPESEHFDKYWEQPQEERDISDHAPVIATFKIQ